MFNSEAVTRGVRVSVQSEYAPEQSQPSKSQWFFLYTVTISNEGGETVQLLTRHWIIKDGTGHTEAIVATNLAAAQRFTDRVDAAAVMVNASTAFTDGEQFGFGAEIGISTQKLHARGPMGLPELTSTKWIVWGDGHTRPA